MPFNCATGLIAHLEEADTECAAKEREALLTFVVAGGGFAGVGNDRQHQRFPAQRVAILSASQTGDAARRARSSRRLHFARAWRRPWPLRRQEASGARGIEIRHRTRSAALHRVKFI